MSRLSEQLPALEPLDSTDTRRRSELALGLVVSVAVTLVALLLLVG